MSTTHNGENEFLFSFSKKKKNTSRRKNERKWMRNAISECNFNKNVNVMNSLQYKLYDTMCINIYYINAIMVNCLWIKLSLRQRQHQHHHHHRLSLSMWRNWWTKLQMELRIIVRLTKHAVHVHIVVGIGMCVRAASAYTQKHTYAWSRLLSLPSFFIRGEQFVYRFRTIIIQCFIN